MSFLFQTMKISWVSLVLVACSNTPLPCEDILEVKRQAAQCDHWRKIMNNNDYPQQAITAKKRYVAECENLRFYRDDYDTICKGNETAIGAKNEK